MPWRRQSVRGLLLLQTSAGGRVQMAKSLACTRRAAVRVVGWLVFLRSG